MKLYTYFRSSAAYRVRIVLGLKGLASEQAFVHMLRGGGEQHQPAYRAINPQGLVPTLETEDAVLTQSIAICEYLEERYPEPPLLPRDLQARAYVRAVMSAVACEIHPLNNLRVLKHLTGAVGVDEETKLAWYRHWIVEGFRGLEALISSSGRAGSFALAESPTLADAFIVPQVYNARRFDCPLEDYPNIVRIAKSCSALPAFEAASPEKQPDAGG